MTYKENLINQIKDACGKVVYTYTTHLMQVGIDEKRLKISQNTVIALSAISTTGIISSLIFSQTWAAIVSAVISSLSLGLTLFSKEWNLKDKIAKHQNTADELWIIREDYISLLTDSQILDDDVIAKKRDALNAEVARIYKVAPHTRKSAYEQAKHALQEGGSQYFSVEELNHILPINLRENEKV